MTKIIGAPEDRRREQFSATVLHHPPGEPGHVYVAGVVAQVRANSLEELAQQITELSQEPERTRDA